MGYKFTYKGHGIFKKDNRYYCYDKLSRKSESFNSEKELKDAIDTDNISYGSRLNNYSPCQN